ncbi:MAG: hypothetical protein ACR2QR_01795, partial [Woeseiaceae bacterium]
MFVKSVRMHARDVAIIAVSIFALALSSMVEAQDQTQEQLLACDRISNTKDRLECFNTVVGGLKEDAIPATAPPPTAAEAMDSVAAPMPDPVEAAPAAAPAAVVKEAAELPPAAPAVAIDEVAEVPPMAPAAADSDFGLEDQKAKAARQAERERQKEEQFEEVNSTIVEVRQVTGRRFEARLENGQVWRETEATRTVRMPKVGDTVR